MRIIGGSLRGRRFHPPAQNWPTRPTTDISKEGLFNILTNLLDFEEMQMLDLFGGTGSHCYECISRGCQDATYVDKFPGCVAFVEKTSAELGIRQYIHIVRSDVFRFLASNTRQFTYIFAGPPYPLTTLRTIPDVIFERKTLAEGGLFVLEHNPDHDFSHHPRCTQVRHYGTTYFSFFQ